MQKIGLLSLFVAAAAVCVGEDVSSAPAPSAEYGARTFRLIYADAKAVAERLNRQMGRGTAVDGSPREIAVAFEEANAVAVTAPPKTVEACAEIIRSIDVKPRQVYVEARFVGLTTTAARNLGLKWNMLRSGVGVSSASAVAGITAQHVPKGVTEYTESLSGGRNGGFTSQAKFDLANQDKLRGLWTDTSYFQGTISSSEMHLLLQAFDEDGDTKIFANPKILVSSGKEAVVDMTSKRPYVELAAKRVVGDKNNILDVEAKLAQIPGKDATFSGEVFFGFGIELKVLPRVATNGLINVVINPSITAQDATEDVVVKPSSSESDVDFYGMDIPTMTYPGVNMQRIITEFTMKSGETAVIGGLSTTKDIEVEDGIPYLRDIPWIGPWLFGSVTKSKEHLDVLVFVTVEDVDPEGVRGGAGAPSGSSEAFRRYPNGVPVTATAPDAGR